MRPLQLPDPPPDQPGPVQAWSQPLRMPTWEPAPADRNPMFLDRRVYQGSSGRVYPLPFVDRIAETPVERDWAAIHLQNEHLRVVVLPELGGRVHVLRDRHTGRDLIYRQDVIKPALVGLAGPWVSGGIEFNWPQHHRPATTMPTEVELEPEADGGVTAWFGDHDPMNRLKGMHGVRLRPGDARLELRVRLFNRTPLVQTFLWWANAAIEVHEDYQSFFPPDVRLVADHARRAVSTFPRCGGTYYGIDYARRAREGLREEERPRQFAPRPGRPLDDLSWYANIPVPTSYMAVGSAADFVGGYDHAAGVGLVHVSDHHLAPGKKQWTWGNQEFGYAWDRNLTEPDGRGVYRPYIELMAGVYTDNQPDFSFLLPGETRTFTQAWYPLHRIGPAQAVNERAALRFTVVGERARVGVAVPAPLEDATVRVLHNGHELAAWRRTLRPGAPLVEDVRVPAGTAPGALRADVRDARDREIVAYAPIEHRPAAIAPATEPPAPADVASADELWVTGLHLEQYRHATRSPEAYWSEALRRDPGDSRCHTALGFRRLRRGLFAVAEGHFRAALARLQRRNANPYDGEPLYGLGLALRHQGREEEALDAFAKGAWNAPWAAACHHALGELHARRGAWEEALAHLDLALRRQADDLRARDLRVLVLRRLGRAAEADRELAAVLALDPLDAWGRHLAGRTPRDPQLALDVAHDLARAGFDREALELLERPDLGPWNGAEPIVRYTAAWLAARLGEGDRAARLRAAARVAPPDLCFPARLEELGVLQAAVAAAPADPRAPYYLGNLLYDRDRCDEAIAAWERSAALDPGYSVVWRNLGVAYFNVRREPGRAREAYERAVAAAPDDARLRYERDQLWRRTAVEPARRLAALEARPDLVARRDDLSVELCALLLHVGRTEEALAGVLSRRFQPWEGGEGLALGQHTRARLAVARRALAAGDAAAARAELEAALRPPESLGEAWHPLASPAEVLCLLGDACAALGDAEEARRRWTAAAAAQGDFQGMQVRAFSEASCWPAAALGRLGREGERTALLRALEAHAEALLTAPATIDYFATSLPAMLLFEDDLQARQAVSAHTMLAQARLGLGDPGGARRQLEEALRLDPGHAPAVDLRRALEARGP